MSDQSNSAATQPAVALPEAIHENSLEVLVPAAGDPSLTEDLALTLLKRSDLPAEVLERLGKNGSVVKSRKVKLALVEHPRTPRHVSFPMVRHLFTFDLMQIALRPVVPADVKAAANEALLNRMETISSGERLSLAHRASGRVAAELLLDGEVRVINAALENSRLTEAGVVKAIVRSNATPLFIQAVCSHSKWSLRREVRMALLRNQHTPMARAFEFARSLPAPLAREVLHGSRLPANVKEHVLKAIAS